MEGLSRRCCFRCNGHCSAANHLVRDRYQIALANVFLLIRESRNPAVDFREFQVTWLVTQIAQAQAQSIAAGVLP